MIGTALFIIGLVFGQAIQRSYDIKTACKENPQAVVSPPADIFYPDGK